MSPTTLIITIVLALGGYLATYINNVLVEKRKQRLELVNKRINNFYGPLYVAAEVGRASITAFFVAIGRQIDIDRDLPLEQPLTKEDEAEYRIWIENVFMPVNEWCEGVVRENAYLIREKDMPQCILDFVAHVSCYKAIIAKWKKKDYSQIQAGINYPKELYGYAAKSYNELKREQLRLINES
jgi:hypothetical protein